MHVRNYATTTVSDSVKFQTVSTYSSFSTCALAKLVKVDKELSNPDTVFSDESLDARLDVLVASNGLRGSLD